jgi:hypothetical protein
MHTQLSSPFFSQNAHEFSTSRHITQTHRARQTHLDAQASADLTVVTDEGDTVTLSASSALQASHTTYDARGRVQGQRFAAHAANQEFTFADDVAFAVQGDLNAEELADIRSLVGNIEELATDFFSGDFDFAGLEKLDFEHFDTLAGFNATLAFTRKVSVAQVVETTSNRPQTSSRPQTETAARPALAGKRLGQLIDDLSDATQRLQAVSEKIARNVPTLLDEILSSLAERQQFDAPKRTLATRVAQEVTERLDTPTSSEPRSAPEPEFPTAEVPDAAAQPAVLEDKPFPTTEGQTPRDTPQGQRLFFTHTALTQSRFQLHVRQSA